MKRVLFIAAHRPGRSPSQRFRFEQYLGFLEENGYRCELSSLISEEDDRHFYSPGNYREKMAIFLKSWWKRMKDYLRASQFDIIFIQREAFMTGSTLFERIFSKSGARIVFDFDDSIWLHDVSEANRKMAWLKDPEKTSRIISLSDMIFAGNKFLAGYASRFHDRVKIIPTTIDTDEYRRPENKIPSSSICIGWSGSITTIRHFEFAIPVLSALKERYGERIRFKVIGDGSYVNEQLEIKGLPWKLENETEELSTFDIGIMPLPDDVWARGKCGLKGLQYMALEIPAVMSPVGVNNEIIRDGENGFLADTSSEWIEKISRLIESPELRGRTGRAGRITVEEKYSVKAQQNSYLKYFNELTQQ